MLKKKIGLNFDKQFENCNLQMKSQTVSILSLITAFKFFCLHAFVTFLMHLHFLCLVLAIRDLFKNIREIKALHKSF